MNVLVYLVPMALGLGLSGLFAFLWALKSGQYSDIDGAALRVLSDDDIEETPKRQFARACKMFRIKSGNDNGETCNKRDVTPPPPQRRL